MNEDQSAVESLVQAGGARRAHAHVVRVPDAVPCFVEHLEYERDAKVAAELLAVIAAGADDAVRARVAEVAATLLRDDDLEASTRKRLEQVL